MGWNTWDCSRWGRKLLMFSAPLVCQRPGQTHFHHFPDFLGPKCPKRHISSKKDTCVLPDDYVLVADDDSFDWVGGNSRSPHRAPITQTGWQKLWSFGKLPIPFWPTSQCEIKLVWNMSQNKSTQFPKYLSQLSHFLLNENKAIQSLSSFFREIFFS